MWIYPNVATGAAFRNAASRAGWDRASTRRRFGDLVQGRAPEWQLERRAELPRSSTRATRRGWSVEAPGQQFKGERDVPQPLPSGAQQILSGHSECLEENREKLRGKVPASEADLAQAARSIWEELHPKEQLQYSAVACGLMSFNRADYRGNQASLYILLVVCNANRPCHSMIDGTAHCGSQSWANFRKLLLRCGCSLAHFNGCLGLRSWFTCLLLVILFKIQKNDFLRWSNCFLKILRGGKVQIGV